jgi:hypothetical protein
MTVGARLPRDQLEGSVDPVGVAELQVLTVELVASSLLVALWDPRAHFLTTELTVEAPSRCDLCSHRAGWLTLTARGSLKREAGWRRCERHS